MPDLPPVRPHAFLPPWARELRRRELEREALDRVRDLVERLAPGPRRARQGESEDTLARWSESWG